MDRIIESFFSKGGFEKSFVEKDVIVFQQCCESGSSYWVVVEVGALDNITDSQSEIYRFVSSNKADDFDKNLSMLILYNDDNGQDDLDRKIIRIEEDKYIFKKYVLNYYPKEMEELTTLCANNAKEDIASTCLSLATEPSIFDEYKRNSKDRSGLTLLYRMLAKMPFVDVDISKTQDFESIFSSNSRNLQNASLSEVDEILFSKLQKIDLYDLENMDEDELLSIFDCMVGE